MYLITLYLKDLVYFIYYFLVGCIVCIFISFFKLDSLIYFSTFSIINLTKRKLFVLNSLEIISISAILINFYLFVFVLPFLTYICYIFLYPSWYKVQTIYYKKLFLRFFIFNVSNLISLNLVVLTSILMFLLYWQFNTNVSSYILFDIQLNILDQIYLWKNLNCKYLFSLNLIYGFTVYFILFWSVIQFYWIIKTKKIYFFLCNINFFYIIINDFYTLLLIFLLIYISLECLFLFLCYKIIK